MARITIQPNDKLLDQYYRSMKDLRSQGISDEGGTRHAFSTLLRGLARRRNLNLREEYPTRSKHTGRHIRIDGALIDSWQLPYAFWEAKDSADNLDSEIENKRAYGYPLNNIIFEDTRTAVLFQDGHEARLTTIKQRPDFAALLSQYLNYKRQRFDNFNDAAKTYGEQIREIATQLKDKIETAHQEMPHSSANSTNSCSSAAVP